MTLPNVHTIRLNETLIGETSLSVISYGDIRNKTADSPRVLIVSGIHGNEVSSVAGHVAFIQELARHITPECMKGSICSIPFANIFGLARHSRAAGVLRSDGEDINRSFYVHGDGQSVAKRTAQKINEIAIEFKPHLVVDLHTMSSRSVPMIIIDRTSNAPLEGKTINYAKLAGLAIVYDFQATKYAEQNLDASLTGFMAKSGIPAFTVEVPGGPFVQTDAAEIVRKLLWNLVVNMNIVDTQNVTQNLQGLQGNSYAKLGTWSHELAQQINFQPNKTRFRRENGPRANRAGLFTTSAQTGSLYKKDRVIGYITDTSCNIAETVLMPVDGLIANIIDASIVSSGEELFELLVPEN